VVAVAGATRGAALAFGNLPPVRLGGVARDEHNGRSWLGAGTSSSASSGLGGGLDQGLVILATGAPTATASAELVPRAMRIGVEFNVPSYGLLI